MNSNVTISEQQDGPQSHSFERQQGRKEGLNECVVGTRAGLSGSADHAEDGVAAGTRASSRQPQ